MVCFEEKRIKFLQLLAATTSFLIVTRADGADVSYTGVDSNHRWSDAKNLCQGDSFLAKIKNLDELQAARTASTIQHQPVDFWVGVKYDASIPDFVWADNTNVTSTANFEAIVDRAALQTQGLTRCMYLTDQDELLHDDCEAHRKYICQVGETADPTPASSSLSRPSSISSHVQVQSSSKSVQPMTSSPLASPTTTAVAATTTTKTSLLVPSSKTTIVVAAAATTTTTTTTTTKMSKQTLTAAYSTLPSPSPSSLISYPLVSPTVTLETTSPAPYILETLMNEHDKKIDQFNPSEPPSLENAVNITSKLLKDVGDMQNSDVNTNILVSGDKLEKFALQYASLHMTSQNDSKTEISIEQQEIAMTVRRVPSSHNSDIVFPSAESSFKESFIQDELEAITLPASLFTDQERYVVCMLYKNVADLMSKNQKAIDNGKDTSIRSRIVSCTITPKIQGTFTEDVIIKLANKKSGSTAMQSSCVFWDFSISGAPLIRPQKWPWKCGRVNKAVVLTSTSFDGAWSNMGCTLVQETKEHTTCKCNHLTNFAVLMEVGETKISEDHKFALKMVTYIGIALSLIGEIFTILVYLIVMNLKSTQSHIRLNLVISLAIAQVIFMAGISATKVKGLCIAVAITINVFYLVAFGWMVMEGVMLYLKVVKVFNVDTSTKYFYGFAWGVPTLLVTCAVCINILVNGNMNHTMRDDVCWFSFSSGFVWTFVGTVLAASLVNLAILIRITVEIIKLKDMSGISETHSFRQTLKACILLFPLLGLTWVFGVLTVTDAGLVFQYLFTICNSLQGFFIFLFHVVRSKEIRAALEAKRQRWETSRSVSIGIEKSTLGRSSAVKSKRTSMAMNKISPESLSTSRSDLPIVYS